MVTALFNRLGNLGVLVIASALLLGGLAGAAVAHHYDRLSAETIAAQQHKDKAEQTQGKKKNQHGKHEHVGGQGQQGDPGPDQQVTD